MKKVTIAFSFINCDNKDVAHLLAASDDFVQELPKYLGSYSFHATNDETQPPTIYRNIS